MDVCGQGEEEGRALLERFRLLCAEVQAEAAREAAAAALRAAAPVVYLSYRVDEPLALACAVSQIHTAKSQSGHLLVSLVVVMATKHISRIINQALMGSP